jgi:predicted ATPase
LSDGTLRFICLATLLLQPSGLQPDTILVDEPELGLHPYALVVLASLLQQASEKKQIIVSTQSVELVNQLTPGDVIVTERHDGASVFHRLDAERLKEWLEEYSLGELWKMNVVGGRPTR